MGKRKFDINEENRQIISAMESIGYNVFEINREGLSSTVVRIVK